MHYLRHSWVMPNDLKHSEASFFLPISKDSFCLQVAQMPISPDLAIFVLTTTTDMHTDHFTPCTCEYICVEFYKWKQGTMM